MPRLDLGDELLFPGFPILNWCIEIIKSAKTNNEDDPYMPV